MVGVTEGFNHDFPGLFPGEIILVDEDAQQFGDRNRRVGVVELHSDLGIEVGPGVTIEAEVAADDVAQRAGHEEVLLDEAQFFAVLGLVVRVQHLGDRLADGLFAHGIDITAAVKGD